MNVDKLLCDKLSIIQRVIVTMDSICVPYEVINIIRPDIVDPFQLEFKQRYSNY